MSADASNAATVYVAVLRDLVNSFELDIAFLRHNDFENRTTVLIAEWPPRSNVADPDPLHTVPFDGADPIFAAAESLDSILTVRVDGGVADYRARVESASGFVPQSLIAVPLIADTITVGVLGFGKLAGRDWSEDEFNALRAIGALTTQVHTRVAAEDRFRYSATHDEQTGLLNRRALLDYLRDRLVDHTSGPVAILFLDLGRLEAMNDFLGHLAGDEFIAAAARALTRDVGSTTLIARLGGDEFVLVLHGPSNAHHAHLTARTALDSIALLDAPGLDRSRRATVGISIAHPGRVSADDALQRADQAALMAKVNGDNDVVQFTDSVQRQSVLRSDIEVHLRTAIGNDSLVLYFQPEIDLITKRITAVEALVRWQHPHRGLLPPAAFIPVAEATNLASELGSWVLERSLRTLGEWATSLPDLDISMRVNVSPAQLVGAGFVDEVETLLRRHSIEGSSLWLEITEVAVVRDIDYTRRTLAGLRRLGVRIAIDDFGTGFSSLSHLKALPVDALKIDRAFVTDLGSAGGGDLAIVDSVIGLAASFGLDVIAEGVETLDVANTLIDRGCTRAQGYLMSRPVSAVDTLALLRVGTIEI
ncbi:MAG: EAL domain-containing protein [Rhodococcus sp. (in: high G+C Gram-positive bacteria)]